MEKYSTRVAVKQWANSPMRSAGSVENFQALINIQKDYLSADSSDLPKTDHIIPMDFLVIE